MRRAALALAATLLLAAPAFAQAPPHAFLFGSWTGGLYPPPAKATALGCAAPAVIFTRDDVLVATLTSVLYVQREIETVRGTGNGVDFRFVAGGENAFGCPDPDALRVERLSANEIQIEGCSNFPFKLSRCPAG
jgi:hypothetical protein